MEFEDILKVVGGFGLYQKVLLAVFLIPVNIVLPWFFMGIIFLTDTPDHWCHVPDVANSNLSLDLQKLLVRPPQDPTCSTYDVNYTSILHAGNLTVNTDWPTKYCMDGWQYDTTDYDATSVTKWNMVCKDAYYSSLVLSMAFVGIAIGSPFYGFLSDRFGRKPVYLTISLMVAVLEISSVYSPYFALFVILKTIQGSFMNSMFSFGYVILLELVSPEVRSLINNAATNGWSIGLCLLPLVAWLSRNWVYLSIVNASCAAAVCLYWLILPESPRWLISEERYENAHEILVKISKWNGKTDLKDEHLMQMIKELGDKMKRQKLGEGKHSPRDFFRYPLLRKRFILISMTWVGISMTYYGLQANVKNLTGNEFINFFLVSIVEVPAHLLAWLFMERIGRRWCTVTFLMIAAISCLAPVLLLHEYPIAGIIASLLAKLGSSGAFITLYQQSPEIYPTTHRCLGLSMNGMIGIGSTLLMPYTVYMERFGAYIPFLFFGIISFIAASSASFLPETLNKNLPQTIADSENFEKDFNYWSFSGHHDGRLDSMQVKPIWWISFNREGEKIPEDTVFNNSWKSIPHLISVKTCNEDS